MWRNFRLNAEIVPFKCGENLSHGEISPHEKCGDKSVNIMCTIFYVLSHFMLFCCKIFLLCDLRCFVAKSVLSRFTRFGVEKIWDKNFVCGKKGQISGMQPPDILIHAFMNEKLYLHGLKKLLLVEMCVSTFLLLSLWQVL